MDELVTLSESLSDEDIFTNSSFDVQLAEQVRCSAFWGTLHDQVDRVRGTKIQSPVEPRSKINPVSLRRCNIDRREFERLQGVKTLSKIAHERKTQRDAQYVIPHDYQLSKQIGFYMDGWAQSVWESKGEAHNCPDTIDMFLDKNSDDSTRKQTKRKGNQNLGPRCDAVQIMSYAFHYDEKQNTNLYIYHS